MPTCAALVGARAPSPAPRAPRAIRKHAATGWLSTTAAVVPGEIIRLRFAVWDVLDEALDSTVLLDHFTWTLIEPTTPITQRLPKVR